MFPDYYQVGSTLNIIVKMLSTVQLQINKNFHNFIFITIDVNQISFRVAFQIILIQFRAVN